MGANEAVPTIWDPDLEFFVRSKKTYSKLIFGKSSLRNGFEPGTPRSVVQRSNHQATDCSCRIDGKSLVLCTVLINVYIKSVRSALSDLLTTSATHGTFSRPSTKRGLILIGLELNTNARESFEHC